MDEFAGRGAPLSEAGLDQVVAALGVAPEALWAVLAVETSGCGYLPDRRPKILFERHYFHRLTGGRYDAADPDVSAPTAGGYGAGGAHQYVRLAAAILLDRDAALQSASWGLGQIMGAHYAALGFDSAEAMVQAFVQGEDAQLAGMADFIAGSPLKRALANRDWATFARLYNGANYAANHYDEHLSLFCAQYVAHGCPDLRVRQAQVWLTYLGYDPGGVDGLLGPHTTAAIRAFQQAHGLPADGGVSDVTLAALSA